MNTVNRGSIFGAIILIGMGVLFLVFNFIGLSLDKTWPIIFFALGAVCFLPPLLWPSLRGAFAGFCIPGTILLSLGVIFQYNTLTGDWASWAYAWILINAAVGLGLVLASWIGHWGHEMITLGWWFFVLSLVVFSIFATLFGGPVLRASGPVLLILCGLWLIGRTLRPRHA